MSDNEKNEFMEGYQEFKKKFNMPIVIDGDVMPFWNLYLLYVCKQKVKNKIKKIFKGKRKR